MPKLGGSALHVTLPYICESSRIVHGFNFPTAADMALLNFAEALGPFGVAMSFAGYEWKAKYPKILANVELSKFSPAVQAHISQPPTKMMTVL